jgi:hypothetical protein
VLNADASSRVVQSYSQYYRQIGLDQAR